LGFWTAEEGGTSRTAKESEEEGMMVQRTERVDKTEMI
jgi:hypothetical protein